MEFIYCIYIAEHCIYIYIYIPAIHIGSACQQKCKYVSPGITGVFSSRSTPSQIYRTRSLGDSWRSPCVAPSQRVTCSIGWRMRPPLPPPTPSVPPHPWTSMAERRCPSLPRPLLPSPPLPPSRGLSAWQSSSSSTMAPGPGSARAAHSRHGHRRMARRAARGSTLPPGLGGTQRHRHVLIACPDTHAERALWIGRANLVS